MLGSPSLQGKPWRSQEGDTNPALHDGQGYKNIYVTDGAFEDYYSNHVSVRNPVADAMDSSIDGEGQHVQERINFFKTIDIAIAKGSSAYTHWNAQQTEGWGKWRTMSGISVDERVMLRIEDLSRIGMSFSQNFGYAWDEISGQGALGKVAEMAKKIQNTAAMMQATTGGTMEVDTSTPMGRYQKVPYLKSIEPFKIEPSSLTFSFNFGQAGIFSGEQEVVRPIIALARIFIPYKGAVDWENLSAPTQAQTYAKIASAMKGFLSEQTQSMSSFYNDLSNSFKSDFDMSNPVDTTLKIAGNSAQQASNVATSFLKGMYVHIDNGLKEAMASYGKSIILRIGRYQLPPCFPTDVSWSFDFTQTDEYGFPCKGSITFGGLQSTKCGEMTDIGVLY